MPDELEDTLMLPTATQSHSYEIALLGDVDIGRFFSQEMSAKAKEVTTIQRAFSLAGQSGTQSARMAVVPVAGVLTKQGSAYGVSTMDLAATVTALANSGTVDGIALWIDSPGGEAAYVYDAVDAIRAAGQKIPIHAHISDLGASAAYAIACACSFITMNEQGSAGSIGTYIVVRDWSAFMAKMGVKTYVLAADGGTFKGMGTMGTEITADQLNHLRERATSLNQFFLKAVSTGRQMSSEQVSKVADGRVFIGSEAMKLGLVDAVSSFESALQTLALSAKPRMMSAKTVSQKGGDPMEPATFEELETALPKAFGANASAEDAQWGMKLMKQKPTIDQARQAWNQRLEEKLDAAQKAAAEQAKLVEKQIADAAAAAAAKVSTRLPGVVLPGTQETATESSSGDLVQEYHDAINALVLSGKTRMDAVMLVNKQKPECHQAFLLATNAKVGPKRSQSEVKKVTNLIAERFAS